jgi:hypothetical protein
MMPLFVLGLVGLTYGSPAAREQMIDPKKPRPPDRRREPND